MTERRTLYHRTAAAEAIVRSGFQDGSGSYGLLNHVLTGVFVSDVPLDINEGATGPDVLEVSLPLDLDLDDFELVEEKKGYREWCVPATVLDDLATVRLLTEAEVDDAVAVWRDR